MRVLIVDDSPLVWRYLLDMLRGLSDLALLAYSRNLAEARRCLAGFEPDLMVLDIALPDGNGLDLLRDLRAKATATQVAVFSNHTELRRHSLALGADWYFDKSLDYPQLLSLLKDQEYWRRRSDAAGSAPGAAP